MSGEDDRPQRDIKNHILFEIATEVAHRGMSSLVALPVVTYWPDSDLRACSWRHLLGAQIESPRYHRGIWRALHPHRASEPPICMLPQKAQPHRNSHQADKYQAAVEVEELEPNVPELAATIQSMRDRGIGILYGRWLIEGAPRVLLIDIKTAYKYTNEWKTDLWNVASIPSPPGDDETTDTIVFGYLVAWFLGEVRPWIGDREQS